MDLKDFILSRFPGKKTLKEELACRFWNFIFNAAVASMDKQDRDSRIARYKSANYLLTSYTKRVGNASS